VQDSQGPPSRRHPNRLRRTLDENRKVANAFELTDGGRPVTVVCGAADVDFTTPLPEIRIEPTITQLRPGSNRANWLPTSTHPSTW
jgi:hypothetical protein